MGFFRKLFSEVHDVARVAGAVGKDVVTCGASLLFEGESYTGAELRKMKEEDVTDEMWRWIMRLKEQGRI